MTIVIPHNDSQLAKVRLSELNFFFLLKLRLGQSHSDLSVSAVIKRYVTSPCVKRVLLSSPPLAISLCPNKDRTDCYYASPLHVLAVFSSRRLAPIQFDCSNNFITRRVSHSGTPLEFFTQCLLPTTFVRRLQ